MALAPRVVLADLAVGLDGLDHLLLDRQHGVEAGHRVLEDHGDLATAQVAHLGLAVGQQVLTVEADRAALDAPGRLGQQAHEGQAGHALAAAGLADDAQGLALVELEGHAVDGVDGALVRAKADHEVLDAEQRHRVGYRRSRGSRDSRSPSPIRLKPTAVMTMAMPGKKMR